MLQITAMTKEEVEMCPIRNVLTHVGGKWQVLIMLSLEDGALRFSAIKRAVGDITQRVQTQNLRLLERDGYLTRSVDAGPPVAVSYELTEMGQSLLGMMKQMTAWAGQHYPDVTAARGRYDARN